MRAATLAVDPVGHAAGDPGSQLEVIRVFGTLFAPRQAEVAHQFREQRGVVREVEIELGSVRANVQ